MDSHSSMKMQQATRIQNGPANGTSIQSSPKKNGFTVSPVVASTDQRDLGVGTSSTAIVSEPLSPTKRRSRIVSGFLDMLTGMK